MTSDIFFVPCIPALGLGLGLGGLLRTVDRGSGPGLSSKIFSFRLAALLMDGDKALKMVPRDREGVEVRVLSLIELVFVVRSFGDK